MRKLHSVYIQRLKNQHFWTFFFELSGPPKWRLATESRKFFKKPSFLAFEIILQPILHYFSILKVLFSKKKILLEREGGLLLKQRVTTSFSLMSWTLSHSQVLIVTTRTIFINLILKPTIFFRRPRWSTIGLPVDPIKKKNMSKYKPILHSDWKKVALYFNAALCQLSYINIWQRPNSPGPLTDP